MTSHENLTFGPIPLPRIRRGRRDSRPVTSQNAVRVTADGVSGRNMTTTSVDEFGQTSPSSGSRRTTSSWKSISSASTICKPNINEQLGSHDLRSNVLHQTTITFKTHELHLKCSWWKLDNRLAQILCFLKLLQIGLDLPHHKKYFWRQLERLVQAGCPSCRPINSVTALTRTTSEHHDENNWKCQQNAITYASLVLVRTSNYWLFVKDSRIQRTLLLQSFSFSVLGKCQTVSQPDSNIAHDDKRLGFIMAALWNRAGHYIFMLWFLSFFFYLFPFFFFSQQSEIGCLPYFHTCLSVNLECMSETCCARLAENTACKKSPKKSPSGHPTTLSGYIFAIKARIDNRKKTS